MELLHEQLLKTAFVPDGSGTLWAQLPDKAGNHTGRMASSGLKHPVPYRSAYKTFRLPAKLLYTPAVRKKYKSPEKTHFMRSLLLLTFALMITHAPAMAQNDSIKAKIDRAAKDPKNEERAARADVRLIDKTKIFDSTQTKQPLMQQKKKKKTCRKQHS